MFDTPSTDIRNPKEPLTTSEWLHTRQGKRALRTSILPALERAGIVPEGSALAYRESSPLREFPRRLLARRRLFHRSSDWGDDSVPEDASPHHGGSSYGHTTSASLPQAYTHGGYGDSSK